MSIDTFTTSADVHAVDEIIEREFGCNHDATIMVRFTNAAGVVSVRWQCQRCGGHQGDIKRKDVDDVDSLPAWNDDLRQRFWQEKADRRQQLYDMRQQAKRDDWFARYNQYLNSRQWHDLRRKVIYRDKFECQNCFVRVTESTAHVHHLSYDGYKRLGQSFAFECITLCRNCHVEYHKMEVAA